MTGVLHHDGNGGQYLVCKFDKMNMSWSGDAILASCTVDLRQDVQANLGDAERNGPQVFSTMLNLVYHPSQSKIDALMAKLKSMDLTKYPAENVSSFCKDAIKLVREIRMNFMFEDQVQVPTLTHAALQGLLSGSDSYFNSKIMDITTSCDVHAFGGKLGNSKIEANAALAEAKELYCVLINSKCYGPALQHNKVDQLKALQGTVGKTVEGLKAIDTKVTKLSQDQDASSTTGNKVKTPGSNGIKCWTCGGDHRHSECPNKDKPKASHGLDEATSLKINELAKAKQETMPTRGAIPDDAKYDIEIDGEVKAKHCHHCGHFSKGASAHYTFEHKGTQSFPFNPQATMAAIPSPSGSCSASPLPFEEHTFIRCHDTSYDLPATPTGNVAQVDQAQMDQEAASLTNDFAGAYSGWLSWFSKE